MKAVDHRDGAVDGIEIKDGGTPLAIYYVPVDVDALYRREKSGENRTNSACPFNWGANRSNKLDIFVKWRSTYIPCSKSFQMRFNSTNDFVPHENSNEVVTLETPSPQRSVVSPILNDVLSRNERDFTQNGRAGILTEIALHQPSEPLATRR